MFFWGKWNGEAESIEYCVGGSVTAMELECTPSLYLCPVERVSRL